MFLRISHLSITVCNLAQSIQFYQSVFGARLIDTPEGAKSFGIQWIELGEGGAIKIHLIPTSALPGLEQGGLLRQEIGPQRSAVDHIAFEVDVLPQTSAFSELVTGNGGSMNPTNIPYAYDKTKQLFIADPDGYRIEFCLF